jgi:co-chaperonin GroES (HSP10)
LNLKPTTGRIVVKEVEKPAPGIESRNYHQATGQIMSQPATAGGELCQCEVLEVGPTQKGGQEPGVKKGDVVLVHDYAGDEVEVDGEEVCIISPWDIVAKVER